MRARAGYQKSAAFDNFHRRRIDIAVTAVGVLYLIRAFTEGGRVENYHVELFFLLSEVAQHLEYIAAQRCNIFKPVESCVILDIFKRELRNVARRNVLCDRRGVERKTAAVTEAVEHFIRALAVPAQGKSVLFLIEEIARFLPVFDVNEHFYAVFAYFDIVVDIAVEQPLDLGQALLFAHGDVAALIDS